MPRRLGWGSGARDSRRQGLRTDLALGQQRPRRHAVRAVVAPMVRWWVSFQGSNPMRPPVWRDTWRQRTGQGSLSTTLAPPVAALTLRVPAEQEESNQEQQQREQSGRPQRPGAPSGHHGRLLGPSGWGAPPGFGLHRRPCACGKGSSGLALDGRARRPPAPPSRTESHPPHLLQRLEDPDFTLSEAGPGAGKRGVEGKRGWRRRPAQSAQEPAPPPT